MELGLKDKVFIVTGGSKGIGAAIVKELIEEDAIPVIVGRSEKAAKEMVDALQLPKDRYMIIPVELGNEDNCLPIVQSVISRLGSIDGVVNNAGVNDGVGLIQGNPMLFRNSVIQNLSHYYDMVHYAVDYLIQSKGAIVNISSKTALTGQGGTSGYAASKGAQLALTREWAVELAPFGVRVNAIIPAEVMTPQYESWVSTLGNPVAELNRIQQKIPLEKRMTTAEEIAAMTVFLLSEKSSHTTGQWLVIDGGYVHLDRAIT